MFTLSGNSSQVSDGAGAVLLMKRSVAEKKGLPILGIFRYSFPRIYSFSSVSVVWLKSIVTSTSIGMYFFFRNFFLLCLKYKTYLLPFNDIIIFELVWRVKLRVGFIL